jgi:guanylate kinase
MALIYPKEPFVAGFLYVLSGPSGSGKTSLVKALIEQLDTLHLAVSYTTRPKRPSEQEGIDYHFVNNDQFKQMAAENKFIEYAEVFQYAYGTLKALVEETLASGQDLMLEIDWQGAKSIKAYYPKAILLYVFPPSLDQLSARLIKRSEDNASVIQKRLDKACFEMRNYQMFDYLVINDDFDRALMELKSILMASRLTMNWQRKQHKALITRLLHQQQQD